MISTSKNLLIVCFTSLLLILILGISIWDMNFWPTDAKDYYLKSAVKVSEVRFISQIHDELKKHNIVWVHGKELFMVMGSWFQRLINDVTTLRPFIIVCLLSVFFSSILMFLVARHFFREKIALFCFFLFVTCMWPYMYVLFVKHQLTGLMFFLLAVWLQTLNAKGWRRAFLFVCSGASMCAAFFASTVSPLYVPFFVAASFLIFFKKHADVKGSEKWMLLGQSMGLAFLGGIFTFIFFTFPHVIDNTRAYFEYVRISQGTNHFYFNQPVLQQWIDGDIPSTRGGWVWVFKYLFLMIPVLCVSYLISLGYLIKKCIVDWRDDLKRVGIVIGVFLLSFSPIMMAEAKRVAQYGANYFPALIGALLFICYAVYVYFDEDQKEKKRYGFILIVLLSITHVLFNAEAFFTDIYPTRMANTFLSKKIKDLDLQHVYSYPNEVHRQANTILENINPELKEVLQIRPLQSLVQAPDGYFLMPPITEDSVFVAAHGSYTKFDKDLFLNQLLRKSDLDQYAVASFKTLASSKYWPHEAEIPTYRYLMRGLYPKDNVEMGKVWLIDMAKLNQDKTKYLPQAQDVRMLNKHIRNIGNADGLYEFGGKVGVLSTPASLSTYVARMTKVGNPSDQLIAYAFRLYDHNGEFSVWQPFAPSNKSLPVDAKLISKNPKGALATFTFDPPLNANAGPYRIMIYRTGKKENENYYRIYAKFQNFIDIN